jgi:pSer/pThr/pTyr-binding forkhead associated (FHA) protein
MAKLVVITKGLAAASHELGEKWATIGRADGNDFQIAEASVSGRHCEVKLRGEELLVRDLQSTNGTFAAGQKISESVVKPGQTLRVGEVELRFENSAPENSPGTSFVTKMLATNTAAGAKKNPTAEPGKTISVAPGAEIKPMSPPETSVTPVKKIPHFIRGRQPRFFGNVHGVVRHLVEPIVGNSFRRVCRPRAGHFAAGSH